MGIEEELSWVLLTGATGFLGQVLLCALLGSGRRVLCLVRAETPAMARRRLVEALAPWGCQAEPYLENGRLAVVRGNLHLPLAGLEANVRHALRGRIESVVHAAGSTRFNPTASGEPHRTNVEGTRQVFELARESQCHDWHLFSSAYVAGRTGFALEERPAEPPLFRNAYEQSKWLAERETAEAAGRLGATLTTYRPSIVVGDSRSGMATRFVGIYYLFRATSMLAKRLESHPGVDRFSIPLRIAASPIGRGNLICVDDVGRTFLDLFNCRAARGGIYHLTHPAPPANQQVKRVLEAYYGIAGGRFGDGADSPAGLASAGSSPFQQWFDETAAPVSGYLFDSPVFDRTAVGRFETRAPAEWTDQRLRRLIDYAESVGWRGAESRRVDDVEGVSAYFRDFLPARVIHSQLGRISRFQLDVQFDIGMHPEGRWWCRFRDGRVAEVHPGEHRAFDVRYRTSVPRFWAAVAGEVSGAELFLSGDAQVDGDIERALKFATLLEAFVREHPYRREPAGSG